MITRTIEQPVRAFIEAKTLTVTADPEKDMVKFEHLSRGFALDIERTRDLASQLNSLLAEIEHSNR